MTAEQIRTVMEAHPTLTAAGFGLDDFPSCQTQEAFDSYRDRLSGAVDQCTRAEKWLEPLPRTKQVNRRHHSYALKHLAERAQGDYISNGALITAAIYLGFAVRPWMGVNAVFNISQRAVMDAKEKDCGIHLRGPRIGQPLKTEARK